MNNHQTLDFLIIGAQKSGSSFVHDCLREHPGIYLPKDEMRFFQDPYFDEEKSYQFLASLQRDSRVIGIKRPDYLGRPECAARIHRFAPQARLITVLRDPVDRAVSAFFWYQRLGVIPLGPLNDGLAKLMSGAYATQYPRSSEIIEFGLYAKQLSRYLQHFEREQMMIILHRELRDDPLAVMQKIYHFLDVNEQYVPRGLHRQPKRSIYSQTRLAFRRTLAPLYFGSMVDKEGNLFLNPRRNIVSRGIHLLVAGFDRVILANVLPNTKPQLPKDLDHQLRHLYANDVKALSGLLDQDLSAWLNS